MTKSIEYFLKKLISASDGPLLAEKLADKISHKIMKNRKGSDNFVKKISKSKGTEELEHLETAISRVMRQTKDDFKNSYALVIERIHKTGMDPLFQGPLPPCIKVQLETQKLMDTENASSSMLTPKTPNQDSTTISTTNTTEEVLKV